jgi:hypothetical protein
LMFSVAAYHDKEVVSVFVRFFIAPLRCARAH